MPSHDSREPPTYDGQVDTNYMKTILTEGFTICLLNVHFIEDTLKCPSTRWQPENASLWWASRLLLYEIVAFNSKLLTNMIYNCVLFTVLETTIKRTICCQVIGNVCWLPPPATVALRKIELITTHVKPSCWKHLSKIRFSVFSDNTC